MWAWHYLAFRLDEMAFMELPAWIDQLCIASEGYVQVIGVGHVLHHSSLMMSKCILYCFQNRMPSI